MSNIKTVQEKINTYSKELRLPAFRKYYKQLAELAARQKSSYENFLVSLLEKELEERIKNRKMTRIRMAEFPYKKYLEDLQTDQLPADAQEKLVLLERLDFIDRGQNVVLAGNPGTGKTHMAIGLAIKACMEDYKVLFTTVTRLLTQIKECRSQKTLRTLENKFEKYDLVI